MLTAKEAKKIAKKSTSYETKSQLDFAEKCINYAAEKGEMRCYCGKYLGSQAINNLEEFGYKVTNESTQRDGTMFLISWE